MYNLIFFIVGALLSEQVKRMFDSVLPYILKLIS